MHNVENYLREHLMRFKVVKVVVQNSTTYDGRYGEEHKLRRNDFRRIKSLKCTVQIFDLYDGSEDENKDQKVRYWESKHDIRHNFIDLKVKFDKCASTYVNIFVNDILNNEEILFVASTV